MAESDLKEPLQATQSVEQPFQCLLKTTQNPDSGLVHRSRSQTEFALTSAAVVLSFRAVCREFLEGHTGMGVRYGVVKDIDLHCKKVLLYSWV